MTMTAGDSTNRANVDSGEKLRKVLGLALLAAVSYEMGLARGKSQKVIGQYAELKTQYSALKADYDHAYSEYSAMRNKCDATAAEYAALKTQYDRIENRQTAQPLTAPKK